MANQNERRTGFIGTYFDGSTVLRLARLAHIAAWLVLGLYSVSGLTGFATWALMQIRRTWWGPGLTDHLNYLGPYLEKIALGIFLFVLLQVAGKVLQILMDIEDNSRRAARKGK